MGIHGPLTHHTTLPRHLDLCDRQTSQKWTIDGELSAPQDIFNVAEPFICILCAIMAISLLFAFSSLCSWFCACSSMRYIDRRPDACWSRTRSRSSSSSPADFSFSSRFSIISDNIWSRHSSMFVRAAAILRVIDSDVKRDGLLLPDGPATAFSCGRDRDGPGVVDGAGTSSTMGL